ncbi:MAG: histidine kinase dimerization/phospho-acceptor domain-containing protein [Myxococcota bacterium]
MTAAFLAGASFLETRGGIARRYGVLALSGAFTCFAAAAAASGAPATVASRALTLRGVAGFAFSSWRLRDVGGPRTILCAAAVLLAAALTGELSPQGSAVFVAHATGLIVLTGGVMVGRQLGAAQERLRLKTAELAAATTALEQVEKGLVESEQLAAVGRLSAVIAQEVREPLATMDRSALILGRGGLEGRERMALLRVLDEETDRLNRLVRDLLTYARPMAPQTQHIELPAALRAAFDRAWRGARGTERALPAFAVVGGPMSLSGDPDLLGLAFERALEGALRGLQQGEALVVELREDTLDGARALVLRFPGASPRDDGTGAPTDAGLSRALVERAVGAHGGSLRESGSTLELALPAPAHSARTTRVSPARTKT